MSTAFAKLHPRIQEAVWHQRWEELRPLQVDAINAVLETDDHVILAASTASGKTEAAFLPVLSRIAEEMHDSVQALYISPLKALINDQFRRLEELCLFADIPVHRWHGDVGAADKQRLKQAPGGVLLITPESLESQFINHGRHLERLYAGLQFVVIDELHAFLDNVRGIHLQSLLARLNIAASVTEYASSRAHWPMEFGLLNQDCLWTLDEVQLMDVGLATSAQLQAFRRDDLLAAKQLRPCVTWWMSATLQPAWIESADTRKMVTELRETLQRIAEDERIGGPWKVSKPCLQLAVKDTKAWATKAWETHLAGTAGEHGRITLIIANTVRTARELYTALDALRKKAKNKDEKAIELRLIHSRFRGMERKAWRDQFLRREACNPEADRIIVATQIVEAGVDISANTLFAELAPWPSLVQRFGRAARYGGTADLFVVDRNPSEKAALPYELSELEASRKALAFLPDASLAGLAAFEQAHAEFIPRLFPYSPKHLLLRRELEELVDTTPDLSGADLDISRFIRSGEDRDVLVFWRDVEAHTAPGRAVKAIREELCAVSIGDVRTWLVKDGVKGKAWVWDYVDGMWRTCRKEDIYPGQTILVAHSAGGYDVKLGWSGEALDRDFSVKSTEIPKADRRDADATEQSEATSQRDWESIAEHGANVARVTSAPPVLLLPRRRIPDASRHAPPHSSPHRLRARSACALSKGARHPPPRERERFHRPRVVERRSLSPRHDAGSKGARMFLFGRVSADANDFALEQRRGIRLCAEQPGA